MSDINLCALVMAGGKGTRLWPESTSERPKQYLKLFNENPLVTDTVLRLENLVDLENRYIVTVKEQENLAKECLGKLIPTQNYVYEPTGRNTAPCIYLSLLQILADPNRSENDVVAILPSDHVIMNKVAFQKTLESAFNLSIKMGSIVTIGIKPNFPHTGYGYIKRADLIDEESFQVESFKEKPDFDTAKKYLESGQYFWNAGMFVGQISTLLQEFNKFCPSYIEKQNDLMDALKSGSPIESLYNELDPISIDYAIMEKSQKINVVQAGFDWNDLGSWDALASIVKKQNNNFPVNCARLEVINSENNIIFTPGKNVGLIDMNNVVVIANDNNIVVFPEFSAQKIKDLKEKFE